MAIPPTSGRYATLPTGIHSATFAEVYDAFVDNAPFRDERELIFETLKIYVRILQREFNDITLWVNGGFVTHKSWAPPKDTDVVVVVPQGEYSNMCSDVRCMSWMSLLNVRCAQPQTLVPVPKVQPMGGLIDGFVIPATPSAMAIWEYRWSLVNDESGNLLPDTTRKGFLEVRP